MDNEQGVPIGYNSSTSEKSKSSQAPEDPSNTSHIGQKVEQGVVSKTEGISEQSATWEDEQENIPSESSLINSDAEAYLKKPSPEEANNNDKKD